MSLLVASIVIMVCIISSRISNRFGVPTLLIFIVLGMLFGSDGIFKIQFDDYKFAEEICSFALIFIIFFGGFSTNWKMAKPVAVKAVWLSTLGVFVTAALTAVFCYFALGMELLKSCLIGAVISSTDAASVFSILRSKSLNLKYGTASLLEVESGSNDPAAYMLTVIVLMLMAGSELSGVPYMLFAQIVYGGLIGVGIALISAKFLSKFQFEVEGFDKLFVVAIAVFSYALPTVIGGNGYLAAYIAGIMLGNSKIKNKIGLVQFFDGITGLSQIVIFFLLGLLAFPSQIPHYIFPAIAIALFLTFVARPIATFAIMTPFKSPVNQQLLVSWTGLRGAASIVFAIMATVSDFYGNTDLFQIVFCIALLSVAFQGSLLPFFSKKLDMVDNESNVLKTFNDYQDETEMQLIRTQVPTGHPWIGKTISDLNILIDTLVVMIKRGKETIIPKGNTLIKEGDTLVLSGEAYRDEEEVKLNEIVIDAGHEWVNREIKSLDLSKDILIIIVRRQDGTFVVPNGDTIIEQGDVLVLSSL
ncbi:potassium/proton antiporter [Selenomonadales bacterium OttesenSCG-928-I06]|nr:potassium/proton antiporter [Selenomonadales bacterium OttesenSCG-928-I06]